MMQAMAKTLALMLIN